jgi:hypothetical protein
MISTSKLHIYRLDGAHITTLDLPADLNQPLPDRVQAALRTAGFGRALCSRTVLGIEGYEQGIFEWGPLGGAWLIRPADRAVKTTLPSISTLFLQCRDGLAEAREMYGDSFVTVIADCRGAAMSHILVNSRGAPVPLPFHARDIDHDECAVTDAVMRHGKDPMIYLKFEAEAPDAGIISGWYHVSIVPGLELISEAQYEALAEPRHMGLDLREQREWLVSKRNEVEPTR